MFDIATFSWLGFDPRAPHAVVENSMLAAGKDCIGVKSGDKAAGWQFGRPTENVLFRNLTVTYGHGISIGDEVRVPFMKMS